MPFPKGSTSIPAIRFWCMVRRRASDTASACRLECSATVTRASVLGRFWTVLVAPLNLVELFEVGFQPKESI